MVAINPNDRISFDGYRSVRAANRLAQHVRYDLDLHAVLARERFLLRPVEREIEFREQIETANGDGDNRHYMSRPHLHPRDIRLHAWLDERLAVLRHERHGLWPRLRRSALLLLGLLRGSVRGH